MTKYPIVNGRIVEQRKCDFCGRTIYMREPYKFIAKRFRSYSKAKPYFESLNPMRIHIMDVWYPEDKHLHYLNGKHAHICQDCMDHHPDRPSRYAIDIDITDNVERCFYTTDDESVMGLITNRCTLENLPKLVPKEPKFNIDIEERYIVDHESKRIAAADFFKIDATKYYVVDSEGNEIHFDPVVRGLIKS